MNRWGAQVKPSYHRWMSHDSCPTWQRLSHVTYESCPVWVMSLSAGGPQVKPSCCPLRDKTDSGWFDMRAWYQSPSCHAGDKTDSVCCDMADVIWMRDKTEIWLRDKTDSVLSRSHITSASATALIWMSRITYEWVVSRTNQSYHTNTNIWSDHTNLLRICFSAPQWVGYFAFGNEPCHTDGVAMSSRLLTNIGLFCKRAL